MVTNSTADSVCRDYDGVKAVTNPESFILGANMTKRKTPSRIWPRVQHEGVRFDGQVDVVARCTPQMKLSVPARNVGHLVSRTSFFCWH